MKFSRIWINLFTKKLLVGTRGEIFLYLVHPFLQCGLQIVHYSFPVFVLGKVSLYSSFPFKIIGYWDPILVQLIKSYCTIICIIIRIK